MTGLAARAGEREGGGGTDALEVVEVGLLAQGQTMWQNVESVGVSQGQPFSLIISTTISMKYLIDAEFKELCLLVAVAAAGFNFGIPPAKSPPSCGGPPPLPAGVELAPLERPETAGTPADPIPVPPTLPPPPPPPPPFFPSITGPLRSFVTAFLSDFPP